MVNYSITSSKAPQVIVEGGPDAMIDKVLDPLFQSRVKATVPKFDALTVQNHRGEMENETTDALKAVAGQYGLTVERVVIRDMQFSDAYTKAIEQKAVSQQELQQAQIDAQTAKTKAEGQAQAQIAQAQGDAEANRLRSQNLSPDLINYLMIQKWNGQLPQATSGNPFVQLQPAQKAYVARDSGVPLDVWFLLGLLALGSALRIRRPMIEAVRWLVRR